LNVKKIAKNLTFFQKKIDKNFNFFQKKFPMAILLKKRQFLSLKKNVKFFAIFLHSNGNFPESQVTSQEYHNQHFKNVLSSLKVCTRFFGRSYMYIYHT